MTDPDDTRSDDIDLDSDDHRLTIEAVRFLSGRTPIEAVKLLLARLEKAGGHA